MDSLRSYYFHFDGAFWAGRDTITPGGLVGLVDTFLHLFGAFLNFSSHIHLWHNGRRYCMNSRHGWMMTLVLDDSRYLEVDMEYEDMDTYSKYSLCWILQP